MTRVIKYAIVNNRLHGYINYWNYYDNERIRFPYFDSVLYKTFYGNIGYSHYGSSAIKATKADLEWLINTIFNTSATGFLKQYTTETQLKNYICGYEMLI